MSQLPFVCETLINVDEQIIMDCEISITDNLLLINNLIIRTD